MHRSRWDDWSFPKGKLDPGEMDYTAAVREVEEETGLRVRLGPRLPDTEYNVSGGQSKVVAYWCAKAPKHADIGIYEFNAEIDDLRWLTTSEALGRLSYPYDADLLEVFATAAYDTSPLIVIRHAHARSRKAWRDDDAERPLGAEGEVAAQRLVPLLQAHGITQVVSSDAKRCVDTVLPFVNSTKVKLGLDPCLSEESFDRDAMRRRIRSALDATKRVAICSHRPVLPDIFHALGLEPVSLEPAAVAVFHRRNGHIASVEHHQMR